MVIKKVVSGETINVVILPVAMQDYNLITKKRFWFNWKEEKHHEVFKLQIKKTEEMLGLMSLEDIKEESRVEVRLLAVSSENRGKNKKYEQIIGNLIAFTCRYALRQYGELACISLIPKTELTQHYIEKYGMFKAGVSLCLDGSELMELIKTYNYE